jgi:hypothetical protein
MARIGDVVLMEKPADDRSPKRIDCHELVEHSATGAAFRLDPARLVYSCAGSTGPSRLISRWY